MAVIRILVEDWITEDKLKVLKGWAMSGLTKEQIANNIGISRSLLYEWTDRSKEFADALRSGIQEADAKVVNALYENAINGNTTAQIFWLKNRISDKWREKQEVVNSFSEDFEISIGGKNNAENKD